MSFMAVMDFQSSEGVDASGYLPLRVKRDVDVKPDMDITVTKLNKDGNFSINHFFNNGYRGITFTIEVLIKYHVKREGKNKTYQKDTIIDVFKYENKGEPYILELTDMWNNKPVIEVLHDWFINMTPLSVVTDAINIPDGQYIITKNPSRKQTYNDRTIWELEFMTYTPLVLHKFKNDNQNVLNALKKNNANKTSSKKKKNALANCNYKILTYSKKKKVLDCVKTLQTILKKKKYYTGKVDGWFGKDTTKAVRKFQKAYNKKKSVKFVTKPGYTGIKVESGKLVTNTNNKNISLPSGTKISNKSSKNKATTVKMVNKALPTHGKVDKATYDVLIYL